MQNDDRQLVYEVVEAIAPLNLAWKELIVYAEIYSDGYLTEFYVKGESGDYIKCFALAGISDEEMNQILDKIGESITAIWKDLPKKDQWSNVTLCIQSEGTFKLYYDYTDLTNQAYEYQKQWKNKYLS